MLSIDTNILLYAQNRDCPEHDAAAAFLVECSGRADVAVCELVLMELYQLLRNPTVVTRPLEGPRRRKSVRRSVATGGGRSSRTLRS
ncbi:ribonuclease VapC24 [Mycobacterium tuberculosis variant bovis BCG]|nr:ribonuclease VapC24 [Mycobacterium tuberculosis variant bovis BCG]AMC53494.1 ribonuclease VapC24 [Mycobacterium tuberculosis variant bovis]